MENININLEQAAKDVGAIFALLSAFVLAWKKVVRPMFTSYQYANQMMNKLDKIASELLPNGGSSLRDAVNRIESRQIMSESRWTAFMIDSDSGTWESDEGGACVTWNRTLEKILGRKPSGFNWVGSIVPEQRQEVFKAWQDAVAQKREFYMHVTYEDEDNNKTPCVVKAYPLVNEKREVKGWFGICSISRKNEAVP